MKFLSLSVIVILLIPIYTFAIDEKCEKYLNTKDNIDDCPADVYNELDHRFSNVNGKDLESKYSLTSIRSEILAKTNLTNFKPQDLICLVEVYKAHMSQAGTDIGAGTANSQKCHNIFCGCNPHNYKKKSSNKYANYMCDQMREHEKLKVALTSAIANSHVTDVTCKPSTSIKLADLENTSAYTCCSDIKEGQSTLFTSQDSCVEKIFKKNGRPLQMERDCTSKNISIIANKVASKKEDRIYDVAKKKFNHLIGNTSTQNDLLTPGSPERNELLGKIHTLIKNGSASQLPTMNSCGMSTQEIERLKCWYSSQVLINMNEPQHEASIIPLIEKNPKNQGSELAKIFKASNSSVLATNKRGDNEKKKREDECRLFVKCFNDSSNNEQITYTANLTFNIIRNPNSNQSLVTNSRGDFASILIPASSASSSTNVPATTNTNPTPVTSISGTSDPATPAAPTPINTSATVASSSSGGSSATTEGSSSTSSGVDLSGFNQRSIASSNVSYDSSSDGGSLSNSSNGTQGTQFQKVDPITTAALKKANEENLTLAQRNWSLENQHTRDDATIRHQDYKLAKADEQLQAQKGGAVGPEGSSEGQAVATKAPASVPVEDPKLKEKREKEERVIQTVTSDIESSLKNELNLNVQRGSDQERAITDIVAELRSKTKITEEDKIVAKRKIIAYFGEEKADSIFAAIEKSIKTKKK